MLGESRKVEIMEVEIKKGMEELRMTAKYTEREMRKRENLYLCEKERVESRMKGRRRERRGKFSKKMRRKTPRQAQINDNNI